MPEYHITRLDQMTQAVNTFAPVDTNPDGSTGGAITVPQGVRRIKKIRACIAASADTGTDSGGVVTLRLSGNGLTDGQQEMIVGGVTNLAIGAAATGIWSSEPVHEYDVDIDVKPGNQISLSAAYNGVDPGTLEFGATLVFA